VNQNPVDIICEQLLLIFFLIMTKKWLLLKHMARVQKPQPIYDQNQLKSTPNLSPDRLKNHT